MAILRSLLPEVCSVVVAAALIGAAFLPQEGGVSAFRHPGDAASCLIRARLLPEAATLRAGVPTAGAWSMPMGSTTGSFCYMAQGFGAENSLRGGRHLGDDWNGIGQENTDEGDPIFSIADGLVAYAAEASPGWGGVVIVLHRLPEGRVVQSFYGHLAPGSLAVRAGQRIGRGRMVGRIGHPLAVDFTHLHLEIREAVWVEPGPGYAADGRDLADRTAPSAFLGARLAPAGLQNPPGEPLGEAL